MKRLLCLALSLSLIAAAHSQKGYFIYLQTESDQPFFVRLNSKEQVYNSHASGFLTIPKLGDSTYLLKVGFPDNKYPEQIFEVDLNGKDRGFLIKNFGEKGWGLFDLQTLAVIMATAPPKDKNVTIENRTVTPFTEVLSKATSDPSLKVRTVFTKQVEKAPEPQNAVVKETVVNNPPPTVIETPRSVTETPKSVTETLKPVTSTVEAKELVVLNEAVKGKDSLGSTARLEEKKDTISKSVKEDTLPQTQQTQQTQQTEVVTQKTDKPVITPEGVAVAIPEEKKPVEKSEAVYEKSVVKKRSESSTSEGFGAIYIDTYADGRKDTIRILIPNPKTIAVNTPLTSEPATVKEEKPNAPVDKKENQVQSKPDATAVNPSKSKFEPCKTVASEQEFIALRKKMGGQKDDEDKIKESRKVFKTRCFTTAQISNLGNLFANEAGKFQFYEGAYPFVSDREGYGVLQNEFKDTYFVYRFKKLIEQ